MDAGEAFCKEKRKLNLEEKEFDWIKILGKKKRKVCVDTEEENHKDFFFEDEEKL